MDLKGCSFKPIVPHCLGTISKAHSSPTSRPVLSSARKHTILGQGKKNDDPSVLEFSRQEGQGGSENPKVGRECEDQVVPSHDAGKPLYY